MASNARQYATGGQDSTLDADFLDSLTSADFLRSNINDTFTGNLTIIGDLTVEGSTTTTISEEVLIQDNIIVLNSNYVGDLPTEDSGIEINRGGGLISNVSLIWNESTDKWTLTNDGTNYYNIITTNDNVNTATTAEKWANVMTLNVTGGSTGSVAFDGGTTPVALSLTPRIATITDLGAVKQGDNISIDANGVISTTADYILPVASPTVLGGVKIGSNLLMTGEVLSTQNLDNYVNWNLQTNSGLLESMTTGTALNLLNGTNVSITRTGKDVTITSVDTIYTHPNHTGDVHSVADGITTIQSNVVNFAKMQDINSQVFIGRNTVSIGDPEEVTMTTAKTMLSLNLVENIALSTWIGSTNITTLGTISTGTWNGQSITDTYISSATTWNAKQDALTFGIADTNSVVIDAPVNAVASGEYAKFTTSGLESKSFAEVKTDLSLNNVENTALSTWIGTTNITTLGTISTGVWNGNAITDNYLDMDLVPTNGSTKPVDSNGIFDALATKAELAGSLLQNFNALNLIVDGNLTVNGTLTTISTDTLQVKDKNIELAYVEPKVVTGSISLTTVTITVGDTSGLVIGSSVTGTGVTVGTTIISITDSTHFEVSISQTVASTSLTIDGTTDITADGGGITLLGDTNKTIIWDNATDSWVFNQNVTAPSLTITSTTLVTNLNADLLDSQHGSYYTNATNINAGTINDAYLPATISSDITGNSATATALATTRAFDITGDLTTASVNFDGTANVTLVPVINNDAVTYAKIQNIVTANTLLGSTIAGGIVSELSATTVRGILGIGAGSTYDYSAIALSGATIFNDINVLNGVVTGEITTRELTLADIGYTGSPTANDYSLPIATDTVLGGVKAGTDITVDGTGEVSIVNNSHTHTWANITDRATTLSGYGINDSVDSLNDVETITPAVGQYLAWDGTNWVNTTPTAPAAAFKEIYYYTATAGQTIFSGLDDYGNTLSYDLGGIQVIIDGWVQQESDYTAINGTSITFTLGLNITDQVMIVAYESVAIPNVVQKSGDTMTGDLVVPNLTVTGTLTETSARKYKENIIPLGSTLNKVNQMEGVSYNRIKSPGTTEIGFIADDVNELFPDLVLKTETGEVEGIHYARMTAVLLESIKELSRQNQELNTRLSILENK